MRLKKKPFTLPQKVFIVKNYYKSGENLDVVQQALETTFQIKTKDSVQDVFNALVHAFERTGSITQTTYYEQGEEVKAVQTEEIVLEIEQAESVEELVLMEATVVESLAKCKADSIRAEQKMVVALEMNDQLGSDIEVIETDWQTEEIVNDDPLISVEIVTENESPKKRRRSPKSENCKYCDEQCRAQYMAEHYKTVHPEETPYQCDLCSKAFNQLSDYKSHIAEHTPAGNKSHACRHCHKVLPSVSSFNRHMKSHLGIKNHVCEWCGRGFHEASSLKLHRRTHTGERPHICDECGRRFATSGSLAIHIRTHTGERPYKCDRCEKTFVDSSTRNVHLRQHTGESPFICPICGKRTKQQQNLRSHMRHMHWMGSEPGDDSSPMTKGTMELPCKI